MAEIALEEVTKVCHDGTKAVRALEEPASAERAPFIARLSSGERIEEART